MGVDGPHKTAGHPQDTPRTRLPLVAAGSQSALYVHRTPTDLPHRPEQPHAVPYPACQSATQLDLDHHSSPIFIKPTQHRTATACRLQLACRPATMALHCVSPPSRLSQVPPAFVATLVAVLLFGGRASPPAKTNTRRRAPNRRLNSHRGLRCKSCPEINPLSSAVCRRVSHKPRCG